MMFPCASTNKVTRRSLCEAAAISHTIKNSPAT
jgi:hypothetical protein